MACEKYVRGKFLESMFDSGGGSWECYFAFEDVTYLYAVSASGWYVLERRVQPNDPNSIHTHSFWNGCVPWGWDIGKIALPENVTEHVSQPRFSLFI